MFRAFTIACLLASASALRKRRDKHASSSWKARTDENTGACAGHIAKEDLPIYFPLYCSGNVNNLKFSANAWGHTSPRIRLSIGSIDKGYKTYPIYPATRTWTVSHDSLTAGMHILRYSGDRLSFNYLEVTGDGAGCSFEDAPGYDPSSFTNTGLDIITRAVGPRENNFSDARKRQLYFAHEMLGTNADNTISATAIADGVYGWMYMYSKEQAAKDNWLSYKENGGMYEESDMTPYPKVSLNQLPGRSGDDMVVCEPCNTLSNIMFHEAAVWTTCKGYPFTGDESATLMATLSFTGVGSLFFHASATKAGHLADVYAMDLHMYHIHQLMIRSAISQAGDALTQADRHSLMYLNKDFGLATDKAKELTALFREDYDRDRIWDYLRNRPPNYEMTIATSVLSVVESMYGNWPIPGVGALMEWIFETVLNLLGGSDIEWVKGTYQPALKKTFKVVNYCGDRGKLVGGMLAFAVTFIEAFVFQEELIPVPDWVRDVFKVLADLGISADGTSDMEARWDCYNGQRDYCYDRSPHGTWHEKASHGLIHIANAAALMVSDVKKGSC